MSVNSKKRLSAGWYALLVFMGLIDLGLLLKRFVHGYNMALFNPKGYIAKEQHSVMLFTAIVLLSVAIPTILVLYFVAYKYRESNTKATYEPNKKHGKKLNITLWGIPFSVLLLLASVMLPVTHKLEPQKVITANTNNKPMTIQVVSMRWKWLFIYPEQHIATVNFVQMPINTPIEFEMTADDSPMSSFWIPNLAGQLYTMTGMVNHLNMMADTPGDYPGSSAEINGAGFAGMKFTARASSTEDFEQWVQQVRQSPLALDTAKYDKLVKPSEYETVALFNSYDATIYDKVLSKYTGPGGHSHE
jgi:cytochrome o ubiquinol oxidase subunit 2